MAGPLALVDHRIAAEAEVQLVDRPHQHDAARVVELAVNGHADLIVSGDGDLLVLNPFRDIPIVTPAIFVQAVAG
jgi:predicted nucleic acid-binding protein